MRPEQSFSPPHAAALAGAKVLADDGSAETAEETAEDYLASGAAVAITFDQLVAVSDDNEQVTVSLTSSYPSLIAHLLGGEDIAVGVDAAAVLGAPEGSPVCIHALHPTMNKAIEASGGSSISAPTCRVWVNSSSSSSVNLSGGSSISAEKACLHGGVGQGTVTPPPEDCGVRNDPFAGMSPTTPATCTQTNFTRGGGTYTLSPGVYCGGLKLSGGPTVTLQPGTYVIRNGKLSMSGGGSMTGTGVTFVFEGTAELDLSGGGSLSSRRADHRRLQELRVLPAADRQS